MKTHTKQAIEIVEGSHLYEGKPSRHCVATIIVEDEAKLIDAKGFVASMNEMLDKESVQRVGEITHVFPNESFTSVIALAESHVSVHTWPERLTVQLDVFLCNYMHDNTEKCERIFESVIAYFGPTAQAERTYIDRL